MEFNEKLQQLRKHKGYTQEELADLLFVSRTAVSKWESGRGFPNIESLKAISKVFNVSVDDFLSTEEVICVAEKEKRDTAINFRNIFYGLLDIMSFIFFFIPLFGEKVGEYINSVSLITLNIENDYVYISYIVILSIIIIYGFLQIAFQNTNNYLWKKYRSLFSISLTIIATILFIISQQPYIAFLELWLLIIKGVIYIKTALKN